MKYKKNSATDIIYSACTYEHLGHTTNYEFDEISYFSDNKKFNKSQYFEFIRKYEINDPVTQLIHERKSTRSFSSFMVSTNEILKILFNAYSLKDENGSLTIPQAGGLSLMLLNVLANKEGCWNAYAYDHLNYKIKKLNNHTYDFNKLFYTKSVDFNNASHCIIISSKLNIFSKVYLSRAFKFGCFQAGHISQNILLTATSLGIKTITLGSLIESEIINLCNLTDGEYPLYAVVLGR